MQRSPVPESCQSQYGDCVSDSLDQIWKKDWPERGWLFSRYGFKQFPWLFARTRSVLILRNCRQKKKLAVILGTEGEGLAAGTIAGCDYTVRIPMAHQVDSLNVAAASAVAFWELGKRTK